MTDGHKDYRKITQSIKSGMKEIHARVPETMKGFSALAAGATKDGALDRKTKELIALAIGVATHCDGCIGFHVKELVSLGVTEEEIAETLAMTVYMGGGPSLMYAADAWTAYEQFKEG
ncbi:MAG: alkylhydroperoxidase [Hirschia sp.]|mgnify:CR=1 FL=1|nr:alkylhydroperoxidase [Hirschia sp.]MBF18533.1 alkylhydroperoxidase [Hirschia sp.]MBF20299.1 alkylhydroperoxidase [Hirschia sp.]|tara:strand:- start:67 stop:420 length:354 start_codon:yes stop_codon:yes gene_type:complete